jgi:hypothetical protein
VLARRTKRGGTKFLASPNRGVKGGMEGQNRARQTTVCRLLLDLWDDFRLGTNRVGDRASSSVPACLVC